MPQPWPAVSPDQAKRMSRLEAGAVRKRPTIGSDSGVDVGEVGGRHAIEDVLVGGEVGEQPLDRVVAGRRGIERRQARGIGEILGRRDLEHDARRAVGARPDHAAGGIDIARLDAMGEGGALAGAGIIGHRQAGNADQANRAGGGDEGAARHG